MSCNTCGNKTSSPCACQDHGLTTPCSYSECTTTICEEVYCAECVINCSDSAGRSTGSISWDAEVSAGLTSAAGLQMRSGDSVEEMLQRISLFIADPVGGVNSVPLAIAPLTVGARTSSSIQIKWSDVPLAVTSVLVYQAAAASTTWTLNSTINTSIQTTLQQNITGLIANTAYKFKLVSSDGTTSANSVAIYVNTSA